MRTTSDDPVRPVRSRGRRLRRLAPALVVVTALALVAPPSDAQGNPDDPRREREEVRRQQAELATEVDALEATAAEVAEALAVLEADVAAQEAALADAEEALARAEHESDLAAERVLETQQTLADLEAALRELAVAAYVSPPGEQVLSSFEQGSASDAEARRALLELRSGSAADVIDEMRDTEARLADERDAAEAREADADARHAEVALRTAELQAAYERQAAYAAEVEARLEARLAESASLEALDAELSAEIAKQEAELAAKLKAAAEAAAKAKVASKAPAAPSVPIPAPGEIVSVRGIQIHESIAGQLDAMLGAAEADGIILGGGGWRSSESQIRLRRAHCGSSHYAIYEMPASSCSPPTARPGQSMHERGLAIDFTCGGSAGAISSRSSPCYQWLAANAAGYGFYNLPSEPWHWSINGK